MSKRGPKPAFKAVIPLRQSWEPPRHLTPRARKEFERTVGLLRSRNALDNTDSELVVRRAELVDVAFLAYTQRKKDGDYMMSDRGNAYPHPAIKVHAAACGQIRLIDIELGLTPVRSKIKGADNALTGGYGRWEKYLTRGES
jgi:P27 family predicted phage terminase small subunit